MFCHLFSKIMLNFFYIISTKMLNKTTLHERVVVFPAPAATPISGSIPPG